MRRNRRDGNQTNIVRALEAMGCQVLDLSKVGGGCPDLLVNCRGRLVLVEVKNPDGLNRIRESQAEFCQRWPVHFVRTVHEAMEVVGEPQMQDETV